MSKIKQAKSKPCKDSLIDFMEKYSSVNPTRLNEG